MESESNCLTDEQMDIWAQVSVFVSLKYILVFGPLTSPTYWLSCILNLCRLLTLSTPPLIPKPAALPGDHTTIHQMSSWICVLFWFFSSLTLTLPISWLSPSPSLHHHQELLLEFPSCFQSGLLLLLLSASNCKHVSLQQLVLEDKNLIMLLPCWKNINESSTVAISGHWRRVQILKRTYMTILVFRPIYLQVNLWLFSHHSSTFLLSFVMLSTTFGTLYKTFRLQDFSFFYLIGLNGKPLLLIQVSVLEIIAPNLCVPHWI
jgi:hypothetical protein